MIRPCVWSSWAKEAGMLLRWSRSYLSLFIWDLNGPSLSLSSLNYQSPPLSDLCLIIQWTVGLICCLTSRCECCQLLSSCLIMPAGDWQASFFLTHFWWACLVALRSWCSSPPSAPAEFSCISLWMNDLKDMITDFDYFSLYRWVCWNELFYKRKLFFGSVRKEIKRNDSVQNDCLIHYVCVVFQWK